MSAAESEVRRLLAEVERLAAELAEARRQIARVESQHARYGAVTQNGFCRHCEQSWPCDTRAALAGEGTGTQHTHDANGVYAFCAACGTTGVVTWKSSWPVRGVADQPEGRG